MFCLVTYHCDRRNSIIPKNWIYSTKTIREKNIYDRVFYSKNRNIPAPPTANGLMFNKTSSVKKDGALHTISLHKFVDDPSTEEAQEFLRKRAVILTQKFKESSEGGKQKPKRDRVQKIKDTKIIKQASKANNAHLTSMLDEVLTYENLDGEKLFNQESSFSSTSSEETLSNLKKKLSKYEKRHKIAADDEDDFEATETFENVAVSVRSDEDNFEYEQENVKTDDDPLGGPSPKNHHNQQNVSLSETPRSYSKSSTKNHLQLNVPVYRETAFKKLPVKKQHQRQTMSPILKPKKVRYEEKLVGLRHKGHKISSPVQLLTPENENPEDGGAYSDVRL